MNWPPKVFQLIRFLENIQPKLWHLLLWDSLWILVFDCVHNGIKIRIIDRINCKQVFNPSTYSWYWPWKWKVHNLLSVSYRMHFVIQCPLCPLLTGPRGIHFTGALWHSSGLYYHQTRTAKQINNSVCNLTLLFCLFATIHCFLFVYKEVICCSFSVSNHPLFISFLALPWEKS